MAPTSALSIDADCEAHENGDSDCDKASEQEGQPMPGKRGKARRITRRNLFEATAGTALALPLVGIKNNAVGAEVRSDRVRQENALPGTSDWMLTRPIVDEDNSNRSSRIEGFCSKPSVRPGESLDLKVSTRPASTFSVDIYRLGYYQGKGGRHMATLGPFRGSPQAIPPVGEQRLRECDWEVATQLKIPSDWLSGVYVGKLTAEKEGAQSYVIFIVRDDRACDFLFQVSDATWLAYNLWPGGYSLYNDGKHPQAYCGPGVEVSWDRPYAWNWHGHRAPLTLGSGEFFLWEYPLAYWMEKEGYDVSYISTLDTHTDRQGLRRGRSFLSVGHDEYWSLAMFDNVRQAVDAGMNAAFFSGDTCWCVVPFLPGVGGAKHRKITRQGLFGPLSDEAETPEALAECLARYPGTKQLPTLAPSEGLLIGARNVYPYMGIADWICRDPDHWMYDGTGMQMGERISGLIGWEWNSGPADVPGLCVVASGKVSDGLGGDGHYHATIYPGKKENWVFNASTWWWWDGLAIPPGHYRVTDQLKGPDPRVLRMTRNVFAKFLA